PASVLVSRTLDRRSVGCCALMANTTAAGRPARSGPTSLYPPLPDGVFVQVMRQIGVSVPRRSTSSTPPKPAGQGAISIISIVSNYNPYRDIFIYMGVLDMRYIYTRPLRVLRSEEHTSELQSRFDLVCRLL